MSNFTLEKTSHHQYITMHKDESSHEDIIARCHVDLLQKALEDKGITKAKVIWADIRSGKNLNMEHPLLRGPAMMPFHDELFEDIPEFCDVLIQESVPGGRTANVSVWAPLNWNERFLACGGGGMQSAVDVRIFEGVRSSTVVCGVRNGFVSACSDGGIDQMRFFDWGLDPVTKELDYEMIKDLSDRALHSATVMGKIIAEALYGMAPKYSYYQGASNGGRMGLAAVQCYPEDYDGAWADAPAVSHPRFQMAGGWPLYVMNWHNNFLYEAKLDAFRNAVLQQFGCEGGYVDSADPAPFDPFSIVGQDTADGPITELDAQVMKEIFDGPHTRDGQRLYYGMFPGTYTWGMQGLIHYVDDGNGGRTPSLFEIPDNFVKGWVKQDPDWDWKTMTREEYEELFSIAREKFSHIIKGEEGDISAFQAHCGKLLLSHCAFDELIFPGGTVDVYRRMINSLGGEDKSLDTLRFFLTPGGSHCGHYALGITLADGMIALMNWVEKGIVPETVPLEMKDVRFNPAPTVQQATGRLYKLSEHPDFEFANNSVFDV